MESTYQGANVLTDELEVHNSDDVINVSPPATNVTVRNIIASSPDAPPYLVPLAVVGIIFLKMPSYTTA
jgi:hypothetical protein